MLKAALIAICAMLLIALVDMPYGYYQFLRIATTGVLVWVLLHIWEESNLLERFGLIALAISYNPIFKISMERETHAIVNIATVLVIGFVFARHRPQIDA